MSESKVFARLPLPWLVHGALTAFDRPGGFDALKILFALAESRGRLEIKDNKFEPMARFVASAHQLAKRAHLARRRVFPAVRFLEEEKIITATRVRGRATEYAFAESKQWFKYPYRHATRFGLFELLRERAPVNHTALKLYLVLIHALNGASGESQIGYTKIAAYGVRREDIRLAIGVLQRAGAIHTYGEDEATRGVHNPNIYLVRGLGYVPRFDREGGPILTETSPIAQAFKKAGLREKLLGAQVHTEPEPRQR